MSTRNLRKLAESKMQVKKEPVEESLEDFEPQFVKKATSAFAGLMISSPSHSEPEESDGDGMEVAAASAPTASRRKKNNKKKKRKHKCIDTAPQSGVDEVERSVREVNEILGEPEAAPVEQPISHIEMDLLKVDAKYLDFNEEYRRRFGPDPEDERNRKRRNNTSIRRMIVFSRDKYEFAVRGLRMDLIEVEDGIKYFKYSYNPEYADHMALLMQVLKRRFDQNIRENPDMFNAQTVEALFENLTLYFEMDETSVATHALEQTIYYLQIIADQSFNYYDGRTRLEYKVVENRIFHIALLKYIYVLTNKACHRTALEVAKIMLNLDPSDPLAVVFVVDTIAIRAREYNWLLKLYNRWIEDRDISRLFHMSYSVALAMWHIARKTKNPDDQVTADEHLKKALEEFPNVACMLMTFTERKNQEVMTNEMFSTLVNATTSSDLMALERLYVKMTYHLWRETGLMDWLIEMSLKVARQFTIDPIMKVRVAELGKQRSLFFRRYPLEIKRHLHTIISMSEFISEGHVPDVPRSISFNPYPSEGKCIDSNQYYLRWGIIYPRPQAQCPAHMILSFIRSVLPEVPENHGG